jgi:hypothetical protein
MRGEGHRGTVWRSARPARDGTASSTWPGRVSSEGGGRGRGRGSGTDRCCAAPARAWVRPERPTRRETRGGGREGNGRRRMRGPRGGGRGEEAMDPPAHAPRRTPVPVRSEERAHSSLCLVRVARSFAVRSSSLQRLQGRMRGSSAAGRAEFYQMRKLAISIHT